MLLVRALDNAYHSLDLACSHVATALIKLLRIIETIILFFSLLMWVSNRLGFYELTMMKIAKNPSAKYNRKMMFEFSNAVFTAPVIICFNG